ncbi:hypothetical protein RHSIM_Rhsim07G0134600 [Rhododendron simsii]|uniref:Protein FAR1-RELATED SEQUENCE n=1 Tax=Rhododendron simsii TaxID=118357 RepID=A0A834GLT0_RHOSS|nr:hypothetical protein RHSIM_Rhsim07G0134600 [Rhododendron simsii]
MTPPPSSAGQIVVSIMGFGDFGEVCKTFGYTRIHFPRVDFAHYFLPEERPLGVMATPNRSTNKKGVSYDWESNFESECCPSREDSHSNTFGDDSLRLLNDTEIVQMKFVSEEEAGRFYNAYAKAMGFSVRKHKSKLHRGIEGSNTIGNYDVTEFVSTHNHPLAAQHCVPFLRSHRHVGDADVAQLMAMRNVGMKPSQIMDYMRSQSGGFQNVGFTFSDLRNKLHRERTQEILNGDAEGALGYLAAQVSNDPRFFFKYSVDEEDRLETLFWAEGRSQMEYAAFGDVPHAIEALSGCD